MIKRVKRELVYQGSILDIYNDSIQLPDGKIEHWDYVEHRKGAAAVVAVLEDGRLLLVRQYRNALNRFTLEIPAGARDSVTEPTSECAARELEEEKQKITTVAFCNELVDVYVARSLIPSKQKLDEGEELDLEAHTLEDLCEKIYKGEIQDGKTVAAIMAYKNKYHL